MDALKKVIKENLTNTSLKINSRKIKVLALACFWTKENFSGIIQYYGKKYYCYYDRYFNDVIVENC